MLSVMTNNDWITVARLGKDNKHHIIITTIYLIKWWTREYLIYRVSSVYVSCKVVPTITITPTSVGNLLLNLFKTLTDTQNTDSWHQISVPHHWPCHRCLSVFPRTVTALNSSYQIQLLPLSLRLSISSSHHFIRSNWYRLDDNWSCVSFYFSSLLL